MRPLTFLDSSGPARPTPPVEPGEEFPPGRAGSCCPVPGTGVADRVRYEQRRAQRHIPVAVQLLEKLVRLRRGGWTFEAAWERDNTTLVMPHDIRYRRGVRDYKR